MLIIKRSHILGAIFTIIIGTLLHFAWKWSGKNNFIATFSAVNESTWEHLKLLAILFIVFSIYEYFAYGKDISCFFTTKVISAFLGCFTIIALFYTYTGILGFNFLIADISIF